jgi:putative nucleotidyltransferase with HDIG domain
VAQLATAVAGRLGWDQMRADHLRTAALLHDIGKVVVPSEILTKPARLSESEFSLIREHAAAGGRILSSVEFGGPVRAAIEQHHERLDGSGYPKGLRGDAVIPEARVLAVADVYEAMVSHRPYRPGLTPLLAADELRSGAGRLYDAQAVDACLELASDGFSFADPPSL